MLDEGRVCRDQSGRMRVQPFPWASLERLPRQAWREARFARRAVQRAVRPEGLGRALSEILSGEVLVVLGNVSIGPAPSAEDVLGLQLSDGSRIWIELEAPLVSAMLARVLGRTVGLTPQGTRLDPASSGALSAILVEVARRTGAAEALRVLDQRPNPSAVCVCVSGTLVVGDKPYSARAWVLADKTSERERPATLDDLGELEVSLRLVVALASANPGELGTLRPGDAWLPGDGWWIDRQGAGRAALAAPRGERGLSVDLAPDGRVVVGDGEVDLSFDIEANMSVDGENHGGAALTEAVLDAPVVVRVEVGAVSLSAREWAALRPGDVIETGRRINDPVVLRVAGREVARGELVEIEGELGVRIREVLGGAP